MAKVHLVMKHYPKTGTTAIDSCHSSKKKAQAVITEWLAGEDYEEVIDLCLGKVYRWDSGSLSGYVDLYIESVEVN